MHRDSIFDDSDNVPDVYNLTPRPTNELNEESSPSNFRDRWRSSHSKHASKKKRQNITREIGDVDPLLLEKMNDWGED